MVLVGIQQAVVKISRHWPERSAVMVLLEYRVALKELEQDMWINLDLFHGKV